MPKPFQNCIFKYFQYHILQILNIMEMKFLVLLIFLSTGTALNVGECLHRHSNGVICLQCRDNYHLSEGSCFIDILGCTQYYQGNICKQCDTDYMLVNNLCCDAVCLSKIFTANSPSAPKVPSDHAQLLTKILPVVEAGPLQGSHFRLVNIQSHRFLSITRYYLLYHITVSYTQEYISKRAILDYNSQNETVLLVDWRPVLHKSQFSEIQRQELPASDYTAVLGQFTSLYPQTSDLSCYKISVDDLANVKEYRVLFEDNNASTVNLKVFYLLNGTVVLLANETDPIGQFQPYRRSYQNSSQLQQVASFNKILQGAITLASGLPIAANLSFQLGVEWATEPQIILFKLYAQNTAHTIQIVLHYTIATDSYNVVSATTHKHRTPSPIQLQLPVTKNSVRQSWGQTQQTIQYSDKNTFIIDLLARSTKYMRSFSGKVPSSKQTEYQQIRTLLTTNPVRIMLSVNCKFTEITLLFQSGGYVFVYFLEDNRSNDLSYFGSLHSNTTKDPSLTTNSSSVFNASEFTSSFGYKPAFSSTNVKSITVRDNGIFRRKRITVAVNNDSLQTYYMYFRLTGQQQTKLKQCACQVKKGQRQSDSWTNTFGITTKRTNNIQLTQKNDKTTAKALKYLKTIGSKVAAWQVTSIEVTDYQLKQEYIFTLTKSTNFAIATVIFDKNNQSFSLLAVDQMSTQQYKAFNQSETSTQLNSDQLPSKPATNQIVSAIVNQSENYNITNPSAVAAVSSRISPSIEKQILIIQDSSAIYWLIISVTNINSNTTNNTLSPIIEEIRIIDNSAVQLLIGNDSSDQNQELQQFAGEVESVSSGVIYQGQAFQIQSNVKIDRLSQDMKDIISFIEKKQNSTLAGNLSHIEQHYDGVVTQFAFVYLLNDLYTRYFVIRTVNSSFPLYYMGKDNTTQNPQENQYFDPLTSLNKTTHLSSFTNLANSINKEEGTKFDSTNIMDMWVRPYPQGQYILGYFVDSIGQSAAYILNLNQQTVVFSFIQTKSNNVIIDDIVPTVNIKIEKNQSVENVFVGSSQKIEVINCPIKKDQIIKHVKQYLYKNDTEEYIILPWDNIKIKKPQTLVPATNTTVNESQTQVPANATVDASQTQVPANATQTQVPTNATVDAPQTQVPTNTTQTQVPTNTTVDASQTQVPTNTTQTQVPTNTTVDPFLNITNIPPTLSNLSSILDISNFHNISIPAIPLHPPASDNYLTQCLQFLRLNLSFSGCSLYSYQQTIFTSGVTELLSFQCHKNNAVAQCNVSLSLNPPQSPSINYNQCSNLQNSTSINPNSVPVSSVYTPPVIPVMPTTTTPVNQKPTITQISSPLVTRVETIDFEQIDPNQVYQQQAISLIKTAEGNDTLLPISNSTSALDQIVLYLRASYVVLDNSAVIKTSQDSTVTGEVARYVLYFFIAPQKNSNYQVYRAVADYDTTTPESRIFIIAFDCFIQNNTLIIQQATTQDSLDVDIAYGYEQLDVSVEKTDHNLIIVLRQISSKYSRVVGNKNISQIQSLQLKNGKINYRISYLDPTSQLVVKFIVYYDPNTSQVSVINTINLHSASQFSELSETEKANDALLPDIITLLKELHKNEMINYQLQCVSKGIFSKSIEYQVTWSSNGHQYRSSVRSNESTLKEIHFGEVQTISLDHYRLDQFQKMFILNYQRLTDEQLQTDSNFQLVQQWLLNSNATLASSSLIGAEQKPMGLGYLYHIYFRLASGQIDRAELYIELYTLKIILRNITAEDFTSGLLQLNQSDNSSQKILNALQKQASNPPIASNYTVQLLKGKDFLFGRLFVITLSMDNLLYEALLYHDYSSEQVLLLSWTQKGSTTNCLTQNNQICTQCVEGFTLINGLCIFGCGVLCKAVI